MKYSGLRVVLTLCLFHKIQRPIWLIEQMSYFVAVYFKHQTSRVLLYS